MITIPPDPVMSKRRLESLNSTLSKSKSDLLQQIDNAAPQRDFWKKKNRYYHEQIEALCAFHIPAGSHVLEIGASTGGLLAALKPSRGCGVDISPRCVALAQAQYPDLSFSVDDAENLSCQERFDYVVMSDLVGYLFDVWKTFRSLRRVTHPATRIIITYYNALWEPLLNLGQWLGFKTPQHHQNWLSLDDLENQLNLNGYEVVRRGQRLLMPFFIPVFSTLINRYLAALPGLRRLCLVEFIIARERGHGSAGDEGQHSCSVIVPCRNEAGNIREAVASVPVMGRHTEIIFVDGNSTDGTPDIIREQIDLSRGQKDIKLLLQGDGRGDS